MSFVKVAGYVLAVSIALSGAAGARLQNTGELTRLSKSQPTLVLLLTVLYGVSGLAAVFYFSWAELNWKQIVAFVAAGVFLASGIAKTDSKNIVWLAFCVTVLLSIAAQIYLLLSPKA